MCQDDALGVLGFSGVESFDEAGIVMSLSAGLFCTLLCLLSASFLTTVSSALYVYTHSTGHYAHTPIHQVRTNR